MKRRWASKSLRPSISPAWTSCNPASWRRRTPGPTRWCSPATAPAPVWRARSAWEVTISVIRSRDGNSTRPSRRAWMIP